MKSKLCRCNNCYSILIDENPQNGTPELVTPETALDMEQFTDEIDEFWGCPICKTDDFLMDIDSEQMLIESITFWNDVNNRITEFLKTYCEVVDINEPSENTELIMDDHNCVEYNKVLYYVPKNNSLMTVKDVELNEFLINNFTYFGVALI